MASQAPRAPRPLTSHFVVQDLVNEFTQLAMHKCPGFDWDGSGYQACARSAFGDAESLAKHKVPLTILLKFASTGFPSHPSLKQALTALHSKYQIFKDCSDIFKVASAAADNWRLMCRHIYNRKREGNDAPSVKSLIGLIVLPSSTTAAEHLAVETDTTAAVDVPSSSHVETDTTIRGLGPLDPAMVNNLFPTWDDTVDDGFNHPPMVQRLAGEDVPVEDDCIMLWEHGGRRDDDLTEVHVPRLQT